MRPGEPYPATFRCLFSVEPPGIEPATRAAELARIKARGGSPLKQTLCGAGVFLLDHEPILSERKPWDSNPQVAVRPPVFKTGSSSGRMTSVL